MVFMAACHYPVAMHEASESSTLAPRVVTAQLDDPAHQAAMVSLLNMYAADPMGGAAPLPDSVRATLIAGLQDQPHALVLLAYDRERPVGLLIGFEGFSTFQARRLLNIHDIAVDPGWRGRGIGRLLMQQAEAVARERGYGQVTLEVREDNPVAQALYQAEGFRECEPRMWFWKKRL